MVVRFRKKVRKWRGRTSHGWGMKKKHRGGGSQGGRGYAGMHKHKFSYVVSKEPDFFGYKGFHSLKRKDKTINVGDLEKISKGKAEIDLTALGYSKLLSRGYPSKGYSVKVEKYTEKAKKKIEEAGGKIIIKAAE